MPRAVLAQASGLEPSYSQPAPAMDPWYGYKLRLAALARQQGVRETTIEANVPGLRLNQSLIELETNMRHFGKDLGDFPFVIQWNKRDLPGAIPVATLDRYLNRRRVPTFEAAAVTGDGVFSTLRTICKAVMARL